MQEPKARPSAKYLLQHKFVVAPRPSLAAAALMPLIARSRDALQAMAAELDPPVAPPSSRSGPLMHCTNSLPFSARSTKRNTSRKLFYTRHLWHGVVTLFV